MSCDDDDNGGDAPAVVENDRTEQQVIDRDTLLKLFKHSLLQLY